MSLNEAFAADTQRSTAPTEVIVGALRWEILNDWTRYLKDPQFPDKTVEMSYVWGFINRDFGGAALRCLWEKRQSSYPMFAETVWLLRQDFSTDAGEEHHPALGDLPLIPEEVLFRKIASASAVVFRELTGDQMIEILGKAAQDYPGMR
ncbi:hypothetical protein ACFU99_25680 [Streptomyces sp. NPDC057654]|uniref:hypothetical protein n=1 Tax=Streptomyces sp. NPDC057654 TaxID=3346196 RepID=UPI0036B8A4B8